MEYVNNSRYLDALLLLSLRAREEDGELVVDSTSCFSSGLLGDMTELGYIGYSERHNCYTITEKGKLTLRYVKQPWNAQHMHKCSPVDQQNDQIMHTV